MRFVDDQRVIGAEEPVAPRLRQQDAVGHELDHAVARQLLVEAVLVADNPAGGLAELFGHAVRHRQGCEASRLGAADEPALSASGRERDFRKLGGFP